MHDDRRDVIQTAAPVRLGDHGVHHAPRCPARLEDLLELRILHHAGQTVGGDDIEVTVAQFPIQHVGFDDGVGTHTSRDDVAVRMVARLLRSEESGVHLFLHVRVVLRHLSEDTIAQQVDA